MAKSDFNVEENDFNSDYDDYNVRQGNKRNIFRNNQNDIDIVYDENNNDNSFLGKLKFYFSTINRSVIITLVVILVFVIFAIILVSSVISHYNKSFKTDINIPDVVYLGETSSISAISKGSGDTDKTVVNFEIKKVVTDKDIAYEKFEENAPFELVNSKMNGSEIYNVIVPVQEGGATVKVVAKNGIHNMGEKTKTIYVCPKFTSSLAPNGMVSVEAGNYVDNPIKFGLSACFKGVKYTSSNKDIFTVDKTGRITGVKKGTANLIVTKGERTFSVPITVTDKTVAMTAININPSVIQLKPGDNRRLDVSYLPLNATTSNLTYSVDNSDIANLDNYDRLVALKEGVTTLKVTSADIYEPKEIKIVVSKPVSKTNDLVTDLSLNSDNLNLVQGDSFKVHTIISPDTAKDKTITYKSSNNKVASVTSDGVIYAKNAGDATITATTSNALSKDILVNVKSIKTPVVIADDGVIPNNWHNTDYNLTFSGKETGINYYYGFDRDKANTKINKIHIKKDGIKLIYVKSCVYNLCSPSVSVLSKLDSTSPKILKVIVRKGTDSSKTIYVAAEDNNSMIREWCVNKSSNSSSCSWDTIEPLKNPVLSKRINDSGDYYIFVKDDAENISDVKKISLNN